jgi:hypothetical protein
MSLKSVFLFLFFSLSFLFSCSKITDMQLQGDWIASKVEQDNVPMQQLPIEEIKLSFQEGKYTYNGTLKYKEAGHYYLATPFLYTRDTLDAQKEEKAVEILQISSDTLALRMKQEDKELVLTLVRPAQ